MEKTVKERTWHVGTFLRVTFTESDNDKFHVNCSFDLLDVDKTRVVYWPLSAPLASSHTRCCTTSATSLTSSAYTACTCNAVRQCAADLFKNRVGRGSSALITTEKLLKEGFHSGHKDLHFRIKGACHRTSEGAGHCLLFKHLETAFV